MMVSFLSGSSLLGISSENYTYGSQFNLIYIGLILGTPIAAYFYLPVFYELQMMSVFEVSLFYKMKDIQPLQKYFFVSVP